MGALTLSRAASAIARRRRLPLLIAAVTALFTAGSQTAYANVTLTRLSTDTFTNSSSQHHTELEPDTFSFGSTIVTAFQVGRVFGGGSSDIGFATSTNGGTTWTTVSSPV